MAKNESHLTVSKEAGASVVQLPGSEFWDSRDEPGTDASLGPRVKGSYPQSVSSGMGAVLIQVICDHLPCYNRKLAPRDILYNLRLHKCLTK